MMTLLLDDPIAHHELDRRTLLLGSAALLALAGCGDEDAPSEDDDFSARVRHRFGVTEIAKRPTRVVTVGYTDHDAVLALGVVPVGVHRWYTSMRTGVGAWAEPHLGAKPPEVLTAAEVDIEELAVLRPDLLLSVYFEPDRPTYERMSALAPTIAPPAGYIPWGVPWQEQMRMIGQALGRPRQASQLVRETEQAIRTVRDAHPEFHGKTMVCARSGPDQYYPYTDQDPRVRLMLGLGFEQAPAIDRLGAERFTAPISHEQTRLLECDVLITFGDPAPFEDNPLYRNLDVVRDGRVIAATDLLDQAFSTSSVLSIPYALEKIVPMLSRSVS